jgi:hypothetical protein
MTKRDNELTRPELLDKRVRQLFEKFDLHRGQLPQDLLTAVEGVRKAHAMKDEPHRGAFPEPEPVPVAVAGSGPWVTTTTSTSEPVVVAPHAPPIALEGARKSEPVVAVATDAPAKPGDLT